MAALTETTNAARIAAASRIVVKVGSALIVDRESGQPNRVWVAALIADIAAMRVQNQQVVLVSSGAIAIGRRVLGLRPGALSLEQAQAAAAVGQSRLIRAWEEAMLPHGLVAAQLLLTLEDTQNRRRYLNGRATLGALLSLSTVPVVNENDTVATDEIRYGDNDRLAARVALMAGADLLVLLSDVDGLYSANPREREDAVHFPEVGEITPEIEAMAGGAGTDGARGGMRTKILAAKTALQGGCATVIAQGDVDHPLRALAGGCRATWVVPRTEAAQARKQWIAGMKPLGAVVIDTGAVAALRRGKSLLPAGVVRIEGTFQRGDPVTINDETGRAIGAALVSYGAPEARAIAGVRSDAIARILGYPGRAAVVHADDIVIWGK